MTNVVCVKWGDKFSDDYVYHLKDAVERNSTRDINFVCYSDKKIPEINTYILKEGYDGWWNKLQLFNPEMRIDNDDSSYVFFDLDIVITGNIDWLLDYDGVLMGNENHGVNNPEEKHRYEYYKNAFMSAVMAWDTYKIPDIWETFCAFSSQIIQNFPGDGEFLNELFKQNDFKPDLIQQLYPGKIRSYKYECYENGLPEGTSLIDFHGKPNPDEAISKIVDSWGTLFYPKEWVAEYWKLKN